MTLPKKKGPDKSHYFKAGNTFALLHGAPPKYDNPEQLQAQVDEYFEWVGTVNERPTITGLALYLGFESRQSIYDYEKKKGFAYILKRARLAIENYYEGKLMGQQVTGAIFALKNMGWTDRLQVDQTEPSPPPSIVVRIEK